MPVSSSNQQVQESSNLSFRELQEMVAALPRMAILALFLFLFFFVFR